MNRMQRLFAGLGVGLTLAAGSVNTASAIDIPFDPDGVGPLAFLGNNGVGAPLANFPLAGLDWGVGNALAVGSVPISVGAEFTVHYQARLATFDVRSGLNAVTETNFNEGVAASGQSISGVAPDFEWTVNSRFRERVVSVSGVQDLGGGNFGITAQLAVIADDDNYLKIFYDGAAAAANGGVAGSLSNTAAGTGYIDGLEILTGEIVVGNSSSVTIRTNAAGVPLIGTIDGQPGQASVIIANGGFNVEAIVQDWNNDFLDLDSIGVLPGEFRTTLITSTLELPFGPGGVAAQLEQVGGLPVVPSLGAVNGVSGPDFLMEADSNQTFSTFFALVPEPATAMLGLMGLAGLAIRRNRHMA